MRPLLVAPVALSLLCVAAVAQAASGQGTLADPVVVDALPYAIRGTTAGASSHAIDSYSCATSLDESGGEVVYRFELPFDGRVAAWVEGDDATVDIDIHILTSDAVQGGVAQDCAARGNAIAEADLSSGPAFVVVDSYAGDAQAGPYVLHLDAIGDAWTERPVAQGVSWRARRYADIAGGQQVVHLLSVDPNADGVEIRALASSGCQTVGDLGESAGAVAGINGGYFGSGCAPVSLLKAGGQLLGTNAKTRGAFGITTAGVPLIALVDAGQDWPEASEAHGGGPILVQGGVARSGADAWAAEGMTSSSFLGVNPRTIAGIDGSGQVLFGTVDGRRSNAHGMSLDDLAAYCASADLALTDAVNLDGGGSSTMWIAGVTPNGVVNYPSDDSQQETAAHAGSRPVSGGMFVFALPHNHPPRFQSAPVTTASVGAAYLYDADAIDLDVDDIVSYSLAAAPDGMVVDATTGVVTFTPVVTSVTPALVRIVAEDGRGGATTQEFQVDIDGATGPVDAGVGDTGAAGAGGSGAEDAALDDVVAGDGPGGSGAAGGAAAPSRAPDDASGCACRATSDSRTRWGGSLMALSLLYAMALFRPRRRR